MSRYIAELNINEEQLKSMAHDEDMSVLELVKQEMNWVNESGIIANIYEIEDSDNIIANLDPITLIDLIREYDKYIQEANDENKYAEGWYPVCINEFYDCEYKEIIEERK